MRWPKPIGSGITGSPCPARRPSRSIGLRHGGIGFARGKATEMQNLPVKTASSRLPENTPMARVEAWLTKLGILCAGRMPVEDAKAKIMAYAPGLAPWSPLVFTRESVYWCAKQVKWFPSFGEVHDLLARFNAEIVEPRQRRMPLPAPKREPPTPEQIARVNAAIAAAGLGVRADRPAPPPGSTHSAETTVPVGSPTPAAETLP